MGLADEERRTRREVRRSQRGNRRHCAEPPVHPAGFPSFPVMRIPATATPDFSGNSTAGCQNQSKSWRAKTTISGDKTRYIPRFASNSSAATTGKHALVTITGLWASSVATSSSGSGLARTRNSTAGSGKQPRHVSCPRPRHAASTGTRSRAAKRRSWKLNHNHYTDFANDKLAALG